MMRVGNIQVGNERIFSEVFPEERFCSWTMGEVHVLDKRILPNGRRDNFEPNTHLSNVVTHLLPHAAEIARECRTSSQLRNRVKVFDLAEQKVVEKLEVIEQGVISRGLISALKKEVGTHLSDMRKAVSFDLLADKDRREMNARTDGLESKIQDFSGHDTSGDPLERVAKNKRGAYREIFGLIYECSPNRVAAKSLIDKILSRISKT